MTVALTPDKKSKMPYKDKTQAVDTILLVDDQPDFLENLGLVLETANYQVLTARDGLRALSVLKAQPVSLILSDIEMPSMNGYQLYHAVRINPEWVTIPFLFLSGRNLDSDIRHGKELGVDDYLLKPIRPYDLISVIQGKLRRIQQLTQRTRNKSTSSIQTNLIPSFDLPDSINLGRLQILPCQYQVLLDGQTTKLSAREFKLLVCLAYQVGQVIPLTVLARCVMKMDTDYTKAGIILRPLVCSLRKKLGYPVVQWIELVRGIGYRLIIPEKRVD